jgi:LPXTG-motif cell wall-anchored protein
MFPGEGTHNYGIFSGLDALGQDAPIPVLASLRQMAQAKLADRPLMQVNPALFVQPSAPAPGGGMPLIPDTSAPAPAVAASDNSIIYIGLAVAALAIGGAYYMKKRKKAA